MIEIQATTQRSFDFPAPISDARAFFSDFRYIAGLLPHITLLQSYEDQRYRLLYNTTELGAYHVKIFADVQTSFHQESQTLHVQPANGRRSAKARNL